ncbi:uncharacterized protein LOC111060399, partial [Nilaparvata lugens]|uniref:uncharacterized protein LOC111060399 n=1 Tax=Nilaparvata lugens TaxID=108931 RepID=UPI00193D534C
MIASSPNCDNYSSKVNLSKISRQRPSSSKVRLGFVTSSAGGNQCNIILENYARVAGGGGVGGGGGAAAYYHGGHLGFHSHSHHHQRGVPQTHVVASGYHQHQMTPLNASNDKSTRVGGGSGQEAGKKNGGEGGTADKEGGGTGGGGGGGVTGNAGTGGGVNANGRGANQGGGGTISTVNPSTVVSVAGGGSVGLNLNHHLSGIVSSAGVAAPSSSAASASSAAGGGAVSTESQTTKKKESVFAGLGGVGGGVGGGVAGARQLVQQLVDSGIICAGTKSTIRVVDTLNLGTSQVNLIRVVQPEGGGNLIIPVQARHRITQTTSLPQGQTTTLDKAATAVLGPATQQLLGGATQQLLRIQCGTTADQQTNQLITTDNQQLVILTPSQHHQLVKEQGTTITTNDGEPIKLPENLESLPKAEHFPTQRHRWNTNEEIAAILISFERHSDWQSKEVKIRPKSGSMLLYSRKKVRYRRDGYCWKKRKDGKTTREDHMKLKVQGTECIYGCYVHSAILPTFHRRCYWLLQNPDIVLVHYLNVPYPDDNKLAVIAPSVALWGDKKE